MAIIKKIRPSWELIDEKDNGDWIFAITDEPVDTMSSNQRDTASKKISKKLENKSKF